MYEYVAAGHWAVYRARLSLGVGWRPRLMVHGIVHGLGLVAMGSMEVRICTYLVSRYVAVLCTYICTRVCVTCAKSAPSPPAAPAPVSLLRGSSE